MSYLAKLDLTSFSQNDPKNKLGVNRRKLLKTLDQQLSLAKSIDFEGSKNSVNCRASCKKCNKKKPKKLWWQHSTGAIMISLKIGGKELSLGNGKKSIEVGHAEDLVKTFKTIKKAVLAGEMDEILIVQTL